MLPVVVLQRLETISGKLPAIENEIDVSTSPVTVLPVVVSIERSSKNEEVGDEVVEKVDALEKGLNETNESETIENRNEFSNDVTSEMVIDGSLASGSGTSIGGSGTSAVVSSESIETDANLIVATKETDNGATTSKDEDMVLETGPMLSIGQPGQPVNHCFTAGRRVGQKVLYSIDEQQKYKVNKRYVGEEDEKRTEFTCCKNRCPARIWLYNSGRCIFSPNFKTHNHLDTADEKVKYDALMDKNKEEAATLKLVNGHLPTLDEIFRKNATE